MIKLLIILIKEDYIVTRGWKMSSGVERGGVGVDWGLGSDSSFIHQ